MKAPRSSVSDLLTEIPNCCPPHILRMSRSRATEGLRASSVSHAFPGTRGSRTALVDADRHALRSGTRAPFPQVRHAAGTTPVAAPFVTALKYSIRITRTGRSVIRIPDASWTRKRTVNRSRACAENGASNTPIVAHDQTITWAKLDEVSASNALMPGLPEQSQLDGHRRDRYVGECAQSDQC